MEPDGSAGSYEEGPIDTRSFAVNKQIHHEATEVFFRENVVGISLHDDGGLGLPPPMFRDDASDIQQAYIKKLTRVHIILPLHSVSQARRLRWVFERVCQALAQSPQLQEVRITPYTASDGDQSELDVLMDDILGTITLLRGGEPHQILR
ncbi:MAG: hypothetical protein Q9169_007507 [Polycauliona sp. 2 TL-2023]